MSEFSAASPLPSTAYTAALEVLPDAVAIFGDDWTIGYVNPAAARLLGRPAGELIGRVVSVLAGAVGRGHRRDAAGGVVGVGVPGEACAAARVDQAGELAGGVVGEGAGGDRLLAGPIERVMAGSRGGTGGVETSCLALGLAKAAIEHLSAEAEAASTIGPARKARYR